MHGLTVLAASLGQLSLPFSPLRSLEHPSVVNLLRDLLNRYLTQQILSLDIVSLKERRTPHRLR
jgi:hypothetical protein